MHKWSSLLCISLCTSMLSGFADEPAPQNASKDKDCGSAPKHMRASVRYTTPRGIGYSQGYTTLEGFFAPRDFLGDAWLPFLDVRGHVFDNGKFAANAGLGIRYLGSSRVWGANAYYDYRNTSSQHYNQVAAGLETLGRVWDFRINGYLPVGRKHSPYSSYTFAGFQGHYLVAKRSRHFAMKGANAEAGLHVDHFHKAPLYFAAGPYYLSNSGKTTWGGELRARVDLLSRYLRIEGNTSYDHLFKWIGQAQVSINVPFGGRTRVKKEGHRSCSQALALHERAVQPVDRHEIIPVSKQHTKTYAINPATGAPWFFWFVDNTSSSAGTYESPYPTLLAAQHASSPNQAIYVFPGDGTTKGMDVGITLQNGQLFLGASVDHVIPTTNVGAITIPPLASSLPRITNIDNVVIAADQNTVSGFQMELNDGGVGVTGTNISDLVFDRNACDSSVFSASGVGLVDPSGQIILTGNTFSNVRLLNLGMNSGQTVDNLYIANNTCTNPNDDNINISLTSLSTITNIYVLNNTFSGLSGFSGIATDVSNSTIVNFNAVGNSFDNMNSRGIGISNLVQNNGLMTNFNATDNRFTNISSGAKGIFHDHITGGTLTNGNTSNNLFNNITDAKSAGLFVSSASLITNYTASGNTFVGITHEGAGISPNSDPGGAITNLNLLNNTFSGIEDMGSIGITISSDGVITNVDASHNLFFGDSTVDTGYATSIDIENGITCVQFTDNIATSTSVADDYSFFAATLNSFYRTDGSDTTTNTGSFDISPTVEPATGCP